MPSPSATPNPREILTMIFAKEAWIDTKEAENNVFIQNMVMQILTTLVFYGWLRTLPQRG